MECSRRRPPRRGASTQQAISARAQTPPPPWAPPPRPPRQHRRRPYCRDPASPSSSGTAAAAREVNRKRNVTPDQNPPEKRHKREQGAQIRGSRYLLPPCSEEIGAVLVSATAAAAPVIHAEISGPALGQRSREAGRHQPIPPAETY